jgi:hypothetical protein
MEAGMAARVEYPSFASGEPVRLSAEAIRTVGAELRRQLHGMVVRPLDPADLFRRAAKLRVNGRTLAIAWDVDHPVHDDDGDPVLGVCEHDPQEPAEVMISLNADLLTDQPALLRSTAAHELGHAIFDMPAAMAKGTARAFRSRAEARAPEAPIDWREWRADEFMGAFLTPRRQLTHAFKREASGYGLQLRWRSGHVPTPWLSAAAVGWSVIDAITGALAEEFGVSESFMGVRMRKYGLVNIKE